MAKDKQGKFKRTKETPTGYTGADTQQASERMLNIPRPLLQSKLEPRRAVTDERSAKTKS